METHERTLAKRFSEWGALSAEHKRLVLADFGAMLADEYDVGDPTVGDFIEAENIEAGAAEYRQRIGDNIASYARVLAAGAERRAEEHRVNQSKLIPDSVHTPENRVDNCPLCGVR